MFLSLITPCSVRLQVICETAHEATGYNCDLQPYKVVRDVRKKNKFSFFYSLQYVMLLAALTDDWERAEYQESDLAILTLSWE